MTDESPKNVLALDVGSVRIGIAGSDALGITAQGIETLKRKGFTPDIAYIYELAKKRSAKGFVVGLPVNMDGSEGQQARETRLFAKELEERTQMPVFFVDERLTSRQAHQTMMLGGLDAKKRKAHVDKLAAVLILQAYLEGKG